MVSELSFFLYRLKNGRRLRFAHLDRGWKILKNFMNIEGGKERSLRREFGGHEEACEFFLP